MTETSIDTPALTATNTAALASIEGLRYGDLICVPLDAVEALEDDNSRKYTSADIGTLAQEILATGRQLQPVGFVPSPTTGKLRLVYGFRRFKALKQIQAKLNDGPEHNLRFLEGVILPVESTDSKTLFQYNVRENTNRKELSPVDQAHALDRLTADFGMTLTAAAQVMGKSKAWGTQTMALLKLPEEIQRRVHDGKMGAMAAYELSRLDPEQMETAIAAMDASGSNSQSAARSAMRELEGEEGGEEGVEEEAPQTPDKSKLIKPRTLKELRGFLGTEMGRIEGTLLEDVKPEEESPRYKLMGALLYWLDGRGGRGADKRLRKAFITAIPEVGDDA